MISSSITLSSWSPQQDGTRLPPCEKMQTSIQGAKINSLPLDYGRLSYSILTEVILLVYLLAIKGIGKKKSFSMHILLLV